MNKQKKFFRGAGVLIIVLAMIFSSSIVIANTNSYKINNNTKISEEPIKNSLNRDIVWDNSIEYHAPDGGIFVATERSDAIAYPADDFKLDITQQVDSVFWQGGYFQCELAQGLIDYDWDWRIIFWDDYIDGSHPGNEIYNWTFANTSIDHELWYTWTNSSTAREYWAANYSVQLPETVTFLANTKYWITIRGIGEFPPQACWVRHNYSAGGIKLHEAVFKGAAWGFPNWINLSSIISTEKIPHDFNFQLFGQAIQNDPPEAPSIDGTTKKLKPNVKYDYTLKTADPDADDVYYYVDWGDDNYSGWVGPFASEVDVILNHTWAESGTYTIKAKAKDIYNAESNWTELEVNVPRARIINNFIGEIFKRLPNALPMLKHLLSLLF